MLLAVPIVGKILAGLMASDSAATSISQVTDTQKPQSLGGAANASDFAQTVDKLDRAASARAAPHNVTTHKI